jgi:hypothetical protein
MRGGLFWLLLLLLLPLPLQTSQGSELSASPSKPPSPLESNKHPWTLGLGRAGDDMSQDRQQALPFS